MTNFAWVIFGRIELCISESRNVYMPQAPSICGRLDGLVSIPFGSADAFLSNSETSRFPNEALLNIVGHVSATGYGKVSLVGTATLILG